MIPAESKRLPVTVRGRSNMRAENQLKKTQTSAAGPSASDLLP